MPTSYETLSRTRYGDYSQTTAIECEEGSLQVTIEGPAGVIQLDVETPDDLAPQLRQLDQLAKAVADARAVLASLLGDETAGGQS